MNTFKVHDNRIFLWKMYDFLQFMIVTTDVLSCFDKYLNKDMSFLKY